MHLCARLKASHGAVTVAHHDVAVLHHGHDRLAANAGAIGTLGGSELQVGVGSGADGSPELGLVQRDPDLFGAGISLLGVVAGVIDNVVQGLLLVRFGEIKQLLTSLALAFHNDQLGLGLFGGNFEGFGGHCSSSGFEVENGGFCFAACHRGNEVG